MIWALKTDTKDLKLKEKFQAAFRHVKKMGTRYFYSEDLISHMLHTHDFEKVNDNKYIKYSNAFRFYHSDRKKFDVKIDGEKNELMIPYSEVINFI